MLTSMIFSLENSITRSLQKINKIAKLINGDIADNSNKRGLQQTFFCCIYYIFNKIYKTKQSYMYSIDNIELKRD